MEMLQTAEFWIGLMKIIWINIILSGDNAVVIALAARSLPPHQQKQAIMFGSGAAVVLRIVLTVVAAWLLELKGLQIIGGLLLLWIGVKLLTEEDDGHEVDASEKLWGAVKTIVLADLVMSVDNVIGVTAAAEAGGGEHKMALVVFGLLVSIPVVVWGSTFVIRLMDRFPWVITLGGMLMGWIAGTMAVTDPGLLEYLPFMLNEHGKVFAGLYYGAGGVGAVSVVVAAKWVHKHRSKQEMKRDLPP